MHNTKRENEISPCSFNFAALVQLKPFRELEKGFNIDSGSILSWKMNLFITCCAEKHHLSYWATFSFLPLCVSPTERRRNHSFCNLHWYDSFNEMIYRQWRGSTWRRNLRRCPKHSVSRLGVLTATPQQGRRLTGSRDGRLWAVNTRMSNQHTATIYHPAEQTELMLFLPNRLPTGPVMLKFLWKLLKGASEKTSCQRKHY